MNFIDKYRRRKLLRLREEIKYYEEQLVWTNEIENEINKKDVEHLRDDLYELLAIIKMETARLKSKLDKSNGTINGGEE